MQSRSTIIRRYGGALMFACVLALSGCQGADGLDGSPGADGQDGAPGVDGTDGVAGKDGQNGQNGQDGQDGQDGVPGEDGQDLVAAAKPESCETCHSGAGTAHQAIYEDYKDTDFNVTIDGVTSTDNGNGTFTSTMKFTITRDGLPYMDAGLAGLDQKRFYATTYDAATRAFNTAITYGNPIHLGNGQYSVSVANASFAPEASNAQVYVYVADGPLSTEGFTLYSDAYNAGMEFGNVDQYASAANVAACENCHGTPYMKHGYRAAAVEGLPDFAACKSCHTDTRKGGHQGWQLLVDDPVAYATQQGTPTADQKVKYAYTANVMNDVHMSHAMEFAYPQSMANCTTCHEGKLNAVFADENFTLETCKSCHAVTGSAQYADAKRAPPLKNVLPAAIHTMDLYTYTGDCNACHKTGGIAKTFSQIHAGYDASIYASAGVKYSDVFKVTIDQASISGNLLSFKFSATEANDLPGLAVTDIKPTVIIGLYGYDTKDFIVSAHGKDAAGNRNLEWVVGTTHPRFNAVSVANGVWELTADLSDWTAMITDGTIRRLEIAVMPALANAESVKLALNAPSRTFDILANTFDDDFYGPIAKVEGCNSCHDALATTFHSPDRGGNVTVCRMCHTTREGGSHLEMQSRSIDSYIHAIHSFQPFDVGDVDFSDPVEALRNEHHLASTYPNFTIMNCESCHVAGTYDVPDQSKSLPGLLSATDTVEGRNLSLPSYVTGPGSRACGSCHRADMINAGDTGALVSFNEHTSTFGYMLENANGVLDAAITKIMSLFN